jgi:RNase H-fold protein (predicted Holliday junction resolvase)
MNATPSRPCRQKYVGIDPGRSKCGFAVVYDDGERACIDVVPTPDIGERIEREVRGGEVEAFCVGHATSSKAIIELCQTRWPNIPRRIVDETNTTLEARNLYFVDHPPRGLWRFVPRGLLVPKAPLDGYAAVLIVDRYRQSLRRT